MTRLHRLVASALTAVIVCGALVAAERMTSAQAPAAHTRLGRTVSPAAPFDGGVLGPRGNPPRPVVRAPAPPPVTLFDGTRRLLPGHRVVAFYGAAGAPGLGVLGTAPPGRLWRSLARQASGFRRGHGPTVLPAYELIAYVATRSAGSDGDYSSRVADRVIARYARAARRHHGLLVLDVQPGRGSFLAQARSLARWLRLPYVGLALDPEWKLYGGQLPLERIGHTDAGEVNAVSRWLDLLTARARLPQKLLIVHEFTDDMVRDKASVVQRRHLATVFNVDGFGSRVVKVGRYERFAHATRVALGFKLFYDLDVGLMSPRQVLRLRPGPSVVEYE